MRRAQEDSNEDIMRAASVVAFATTRLLGGKYYKEKHKHTLYRDLAFSRVA